MSDLTIKGLVDNYKKVNLADFINEQNVRISNANNLKLKKETIETTNKINQLSVEKLDITEPQVMEDYEKAISNLSALKTRMWDILTWDEQVESYIDDVLRFFGYEPSTATITLAEFEKLEATYNAITNNFMEEGENFVSEALKKKSQVSNPEPTVPTSGRATRHRARQKQKTIIQTPQPKTPVDAWARLRANQEQF